jgi:UV DNA damage repair endonuclease
MHPGEYIHPGSPKLDVAERSLAELRYVACIFDLFLPAWESRGTRPKLHLSSQDPEKQAGAHAYAVDLADWQGLVDAFEGRTAGVMVEAKGKEHALVPLGVEF